MHVSKMNNAGKDRKEIVAGQGEPYFVKSDRAAGTSRVLMPDASGSIWRATSPVYQYPLATTNPNLALGTIYITGEPMLTAGATKRWQVKTTYTVSGTMTLYLDGTQVATGILDASGNGYLTYNGVRCEIVGTRYNEQWTWTHTQAMNRPQIEVQSSRWATGNMRRRQLLISRGQVGHKPDRNDMW